jgi:hypothetical protein
VATGQTKKAIEDSLSLTPEMNEGEGRQPRRHRRLLVLLVIGLFGITTTVAANITINGGKKAEFGQGLYQVKACDQFVSVYLDNTEASYNSDGLPGAGGASDISAIRIVGLDTVKCAGTTIRIKFYQANQSAPMQIYTTANPGGYECPDTTNCGYAQVVLVVAANATQANAKNNVSLLSYSGANVGKFDDYQALIYDTPTGSYTVGFTYPRASMTNFSYLTLESATS